MMGLGGRVGGSHPVSVTGIVVLAAVMPRMLVVVARMIPVVIPLARFGKHTCA